jgi:hypothetical protein
MGTGIYGVSLGHSASVNASASVPFSQLGANTVKAGLERGKVVYAEKGRLTCVWIC